MAEDGLNVDGGGGDYGSDGDFGYGGSSGRNIDPGILVSPDVGGWKPDPNVRISPEDIRNWSPDEYGNQDVNRWVQPLPDIVRSPLTQDELDNLLAPMIYSRPLNPDMGPSYKARCTERESQWVLDQARIADALPAPAPAQTPPTSTTEAPAAQANGGAQSIPSASGNTGPTDTVNEVLNAAKGYAGNVVAGASDVTGKVVDTAKEIAENVVDGAGKVAGDVGDAAKAVANNVIDGASDVAGKAVDTATDVAGRAVDTAKEIKRDVVDATGKAVDDVRGYLNPDFTREPKPVNLQPAAKIAEIALKYWNSKEWLTAVVKDNVSAGDYKCNKFVADVIKEAGGDLGLPNGKLYPGPPTAAQLADPNFIIPGWVVQPEGTLPQSGDIVAQKRNYDDATGHTMLVVKEEGKLWLVGTGGDGVIVKKDLEKEMSKVYPSTYGKTFFRRWDPAAYQANLDSKPGVAGK